jgi:hypothetical protein
MRDYLRNISGVDLQDYEINRDIKSFSVPFNSYEDGSYFDDEDSLPNLIWHLNFLVLHKPRSSNLIKYHKNEVLAFLSMEIQLEFTYLNNFNHCNCLMS